MTSTEEINDDNNTNHTSMLLDRNSHIDFFDKRDWTRVTNFWSRMMTCNPLPNFILGDSTFGVTDLSSIHNVNCCYYF